MREHFRDVRAYLVVHNVDECLEHLLWGIVVEWGIVTNLDDEIVQGEVAKAQLIHDLSEREIGLGIYLHFFLATHL